MHFLGLEKKHLRIEGNVTCPRTTAPAAALKPERYLSQLEIMFTSLLKSLPACRDQVIDSSLRLICWNDVNSSSPKLFTMHDLELIAEARKQKDLLFARKFDSSRDAAVMDWLDKLLEQDRTTGSVPD